MSTHLILRRFISFGALTILLAGCPIRSDVPSGSPYAWIDVPVNGLEVPVGEPVNVEGHAAHPAGVARIEMWVNGELTQAVDSPPVENDLARFAGGWTPSVPGTYTIQLIAFSTDGSASEPDNVQIHVGGGDEQPSSPPTTVAPPPDDNTVTPTATETGPAPPSDTPTATVTGTVPPSITPTLTFTPTFTLTPTPSDTPWPPVEANLSADSTSLTEGECTTLRWDVENATAVFLDGEGVPGHATRELCPTTTTTYILHVEAPSGNVDRSVTIDVSTPPTPTDTTPPPAPSPTVPANGLSLSCRSSQTLAWLPVDDPSGITGYDVELQRQVTPSTWDAAGAWTGVSGKQVDAGVNCGVIYRWHVRATDGAGNVGPWSNWSLFGINLT